MRSASNFALTVLLEEMEEDEREKDDKGMN